MANDRDQARGEPEAPPPPKKLDDVLPVSLKIIGWTIPLVIGLVGVLKTISDLQIAAQKEIRDRAALEISFFDKQYEYATKLTSDHAGLLQASLDAMLERPKPDLQTGFMFNWKLDDDRDRSMRQVCAARRTALGVYSRGAVKGMDQYYTAQQNAYTRAALEAPGSGAAKVIGYEKECQALADQKADRKAAVQAATPAEAAAAIAASDAPPPRPPPLDKAASSTTEAAVRPPPLPVPPRARVVDCAAYAPPADPAAKANVAESPGIASGWRIDIFWCARSSAAEEAAQFARACQAYNSLTASSRVGDGKPLGRVRLRRLAQGLQTGQGYPDSGMLVRYDANDVEEQLLANAIGQSVWPGAYKTQPAYSATRWYLSMFSCGA